MAKIKKNIQEKGLDVNYLYQKYSTFSREDRRTANEKLNKIFNFVRECEIEVDNILAKKREEARKAEAMEGLYLEVYNFIEEDIPKIFRACYGNETISFGTDFGKNYHNLILKRNEIVSQMNGTIKLNGIKINQEIPEINIIKVGEI